MKYMGHKGRLLPVLGEVLLDVGRDSEQAADPFCGSGIVSWFLAQNTDLVVHAGDLQCFASVRAASVIERTASIEAPPLLTCWFDAAQERIDRVIGHFPNAMRSINPDLDDPHEIREIVERSRRFSSEVLPPLLKKMGGQWPMSKAYGGYYFSPAQALVLDALRQTLPRGALERDTALSALIEAASRCAAAPGHTAQPFQPTMGAASYIVEAWSRSVWTRVADAVRAIVGRFARRAGTAAARDFRATLGDMRPGDLVFADPPYSGVHYSRFYHVLETLTRGQEIIVAGQGRYPPATERPVSEFSRKSEAKRSAAELIEICSQSQLNLVLTFPMGRASNGVAARDFIEYGRSRFSTVDYLEEASRFSTLGGNAIKRSARIQCAEAIVTFRP
jgi:adenine-specific DNA-methyltransferase